MYIIMRLLRNFAILLMLIPGYVAFASSQEYVPDFKGIFSRLTANRNVYNAYNDSIRMPMWHTEWVDLFSRRSEVIGAMYEENGRLLNSVYSYFERDQVPDSAYDKLYDALAGDPNKKFGDPFIFEQMCDILIPHYERTEPMDSVRLSFLYYFDGRAQYEISILGDMEARMRSYISHSKAVELGRRLSPRYQYPRLISLMSLLATNWIREGYMSVDDGLEVRRELQKCISDEEILTFVPVAHLDVAREKVDSYGYNLIRNGYLFDNSLMEKQFADSLIDDMIDRYMAAGSLGVKDFCVYQLVLVNRGQQDMESALNRSLDYYKKHSVIPDRINVAQLAKMYSPLLDLIYFNDLSNIPIDEKRKNVEFFCDQIVALFAARQDWQLDNLYIGVLMKLIKYDRLLRYMTTAEKLRFLDEMMVCTHVATYAHSSHVAALAEVMMDGIVKYRPELLPKRLDIKNWRGFIRKAAMYHDLGKNGIISVVANAYRPLTDHEQMIIKTHPVRGLEFLALDSTLAVFRDITLGHHRTYDGKSGYPMDFDNTASPVKVLIDLITICDCLEAATDPLGRNYAHKKDFDTLIGEFAAAKGVGYNPDLVDMIIGNKDIYERMKYIVNVGWQDTYYDIYEQFLLRNNE